MEVDNPQTQPTPSNQALISESQETYMEEESEGLDLGEQDITELEEACFNQNFDTINPHHIEKLEKVFSSAHQQKKLGIQPDSH